MQEKGVMGRRKADAYHVTIFTKQIHTLIAEGKNSNALLLLEKFNNEYPSIAGRAEADAFLEHLTEETGKK